MISKTNETLPCIEVELNSPAKKSVIWLHGLGADGNDFVPIVRELNLASHLGIRFIFPDAPIIPVTLNNGYKMRAWFDIDKIDPAAKIDQEGIAKSVQALEKLIEKELTRGLSTTDIFLAGFSQGAAIALTAGLCFPERLAGIIALSGYLPLAKDVMNAASFANRDLPIFIAHGTHDPILPFALGESIATLLKQAGYAISWHTYSMGHSVCLEEVQDLSQWFNQCLSSNT